MELMTPWEKLLERPNARGHFVQLYQAGGPGLVSPALIGNVGLYLSEGLKRGEGVLFIATQQHTAAFCEFLNRNGFDTAKAVANSQFVILEAHETLSRFMIGGAPDWHLFEAAISEAASRIRPLHEDAGLRAYGEMVGILWKARQFDAAIRLEQFWNRRLEQSSFSLFCAYAVDIFAPDFPGRNIEGVLCTHTHLIPAAPNGDLDKSLNLALQEIMGDQAASLRASVQAAQHPSWALMPDAEATVLWLRKHLPERAGEIVDCARRHYNNL